MLGRPARAAGAETIEDLVAAHELIAVVRVARATRGLSLSEAKQLVDEMREKLASH